MKTMTLIKTIVSIALISILTSCSKPKDGAPGPQGPAGNANIQTATVTVYSSDWTLNGSFWYYEYYTGLSLSGAVMVYTQVGSDYIAIPVTASDIEYYFKVGSNHIELDVRSATGSTAVSNPGISTFKIVTIPASAIKTHPNVNLNNYQEVKSAFNIN